MRLWLICLVFGWLASFAIAAPKNVLLICVDDLRPELGCYGKEYIHSPNIDALAERGRVFENHYVQAPTCGASRYTLLTGRYGGSGNTALFDRAKAIRKGGSDVPLSMPGYFRKHGYTTVSVGKVSHHPGGRGGKDWDDDTQHEMPEAWDRHLLPSGAWQHPRGWMHGLANGEIRENAGDMAVLQALEGDDSIYPDGISTDVAIEQLGELARNEEPFFMAFGILRPHLPFGAPKKYLDLYDGVELPEVEHPEKPDWKSTWHGSGEFMKYQRWGKDPNEDAEFALEVRRHYAACVSYADAQVGRVVDQLETLGLAEETIIVLWGDHGWHLGERAVWGKHTLFEESLLSPLIIASPEMEAMGEGTSAVVESLDLFPTLAELAGLSVPERVHGTSLVPLMEDPSGEGEPAHSYHKSGTTVRTGEFRLILSKSGDVELYDFRDGEDSSLEVSEANPDIVDDLKALIEARPRD